MIAHFYQSITQKAAGAIVASYSLAFSKKASHLGTLGNSPRVIALTLLMFLPSLGSTEALIVCPSSSGDVSAVVTVATEVADYKTQLDTTLLTTRAKHLLVLDCLRSNLEAQETGHAYWQQNVNEYMSQRLTQSEALRKDLAAGLTRLYGQNARAFPVFQTIFQPLAKEAGYLSAKDQQVMSQHRLQRMLQQLAQPAGAVFDPRKHPPTDLTPSVLSQQGQIEFDLRNSHIAQGMLRSGVAWTEQQFRKVHRLLHNAQSRGLDITPEQLQHSNTKLEQLLGPDAALQVQAALDPRFELYRDKAEQLGLTEAQTYQTLKMIIETEVELWHASLQHQDDPIAARRAMQAAAAHGEQALVDYVGQTQAVELRQALMAAVPPSAYMQ